MPRQWRHALLLCAAWIQSSKVALGREACSLWLAESAVAGAGRGIFAGSNVLAGDVLSSARRLRVPRATVEATQLANYVFAAPSANEDETESEESLLMLGPASLANHGAPGAVNAELRTVSEDHAELRATRNISAGEELLLSYGAAEWFADRGVAYADALGSMPPSRPLATLEQEGKCMSDLRSEALSGPSPSPYTWRIVSARRLQVGETLQSPVFILPSSSVAGGAVQRCSLGHGPVDVLLLPVGFPGCLWSSSEKGTHNVAGSLVPSRQPDALSRGAWELADTPILELDLHLTVQKSIAPGEALLFECSTCGEASEGQPPGPLAAPEGLFPRTPQWALNVTEARIDAARQDNAQAQYQVAQVLRLGSPGTGVPPDPAAATQWYRRAAEAGHVAAQLRLGVAFHDAIGVPADPVAAVAWYTKAAQQGSTSAQFLLGMAHTNGDGVVPNATAGTAWFLEAASHGSSNFRKAAKATYNVAVAFREGIGVPVNLTAAVAWFRKAAEQGSIRAKYNLGVAHGRGDGVEADSALAAAWYQEAAEQGHMMAQYNLAHAYLSGTGVEPDAVTAAHWFRRSAESGSSHGQFMMGVLHSQGRGVTKDLPAAAEWYGKAALKGHGQAQYNLAVAYETGSGVERDPTEAESLYRKAAEQGFARRVPGFWDWLSAIAKRLTSIVSRGQEL